MSELANEHTHKKNSRLSTIQFPHMQPNNRGLFAYRRTVDRPTSSVFHFHHNHRLVQTPCPRRLDFVAFSSSLPNRNHHLYSLYHLRNLRKNTKQTVQQLTEQTQKTHNRTKCQQANKYRRLSPPPLLLNRLKSIRIWRMNAKHAASMWRSWHAGGMAANRSCWKNAIEVSNENCSLAGQVGTLRDHDNDDAPTPRDLSAYICKHFPAIHTRDCEYILVDTRPRPTASRRFYIQWFVFALRAC